jgi:hypothetical protein
MAMRRGTSRKLFPANRTDQKKIFTLLISEIAGAHGVRTCRNPPIPTAPIVRVRLNQPAEAGGPANLSLTSQSAVMKVSSERETPSRRNMFASVPPKIAGPLFSRANYGCSTNVRQKIARPYRLDEASDRASSELTAGRAGLP